jgi:hypothetical protein
MSSGGSALRAVRDSGACRDSGRHSNCPGRWRAELCLGYGPDGRRPRSRISGPAKSAG